MILDLLFPKQCLECGRYGKYLCAICLEKVAPALIKKDSISLFKYQGVVRKAIISLKYKFATDISDEMSSIIADRLKTNNYHLTNVILVPIPLHIKRHNWRGFNQMEIVGKKVADKMNWKFIPDLLIRVKNNTPQVGLRGFERRNNPLGAFIFNEKYSFLPPNSHIFIFDDVYTTGSTINEAKKVLRGAGFKNIKSLTIAR